MAPARGQAAYEPWQVVGLALTAGSVVIAATWRSTPLGLLAAGVGTVSLTTVWCWDAATSYSAGPSLWPVGGVFLLFGASFGLTLVWAVTHLAQKLVRRRWYGSA